MKLIKFLFGIIIILVIVNVTLTNRSVDEGIIVSSLSNSITNLENENMILRAQIADSGSIGNLTTKIQAAGFVESPKVVSLPSSQSVASR